MSQCDGVICLSIYEPYGLVGLESFLFAQTAVIISGVDGMKDYLVEGGYIDCGTTPDTIQKAVDKFASITELERQTMTCLATNYTKALIK